MRFLLLNDKAILRDPQRSSDPTAMLTIAVAAPLDALGLTRHLRIVGRYGVMRQRRWNLAAGVERGSNSLDGRHRHIAVAITEACAREGDVEAVL
jgi:hypothetical protein